MAKAVNRVVKWFILLLVVVFDPLAVTLVIAYNASLLRGKNPIPIEAVQEGTDKNSFLSLGNIVILVLLCNLSIQSVEAQKDTTQLVDFFELSIEEIFQNSEAE